MRYKKIVIKKEKTSHKKIYYTYYFAEILYKNKIL